MNLSMTFETTLFEIAPWLARLAIFIGAFCFIVADYRNSRKIINIKRLLLLFAGAALLIWLLADLFDRYAHWRLNSFDLDGDGVFSDNDDYGPGYAYFNHVVIHDTAHTFMPLGAIVQSAFLLATAQLSALLSVAAFYLRKRADRKS